MQSFEEKRTDMKPTNQITKKNKIKFKDFHQQVKIKCFYFFFSFKKQKNMFSLSHWQIVYRFVKATANTFALAQKSRSKIKIKNDFILLYISLDTADIDFMAPTKTI